MANAVAVRAPVKIGVGGCTPRVKYKDPSTLKPVVNDTKGRTFCGPYSVCTITGKKVSAVKRVIADRREYYGRRNRSVMGTSFGDLDHALKHFGYTAIYVPVYQKNLTLTQWCKKRTPDMMKHTFIIQLREHWIVVRGRKMNDTFSKEPVFLKEGPWRKAKVHAVYRIVKVVTE